MNESTKTSITAAEERFWTWLRTNITLSERLVEALGDLSQFSVLCDIKIEHTTDSQALTSFAIKVVPRDVAEAEIARRQLPSSPFPDDYEFANRRLPIDGPMIEIKPWW